MITPRLPHTHTLRFAFTFLVYTFTVTVATRSPAFWTFTTVPTLPFLHRLLFPHTPTYTAFGYHTFARYGCHTPFTHVAWLVLDYAVLPPHGYWIHCRSVYTHPVYRTTARSRGSVYRTVRFRLLLRSRTRLHGYHTIPAVAYTGVYLRFRRLPHAHTPHGWTRYRFVYTHTLRITPGSGHLVGSHIYRFYLRSACWLRIHIFCGYILRYAYVYITRLLRCVTRLFTRVYIAVPVAVYARFTRFCTVTCHALLLDTFTHSRYVLPQFTSSLYTRLCIYTVLQLLHTPGSFAYVPLRFVTALPAVTRLPLRTTCSSVWFAVCLVLRTTPAVALRTPRFTRLQLRCTRYGCSLRTVYLRDITLRCLYLVCVPLHAVHAFTLRFLQLYHLRLFAVHGSLPPLLAVVPRLYGSRFFTCPLPHYRFVLPAVLVTGLRAVTHIPGLPFVPGSDALRGWLVGFCIGLPLLVQFTRGSLLRTFWFTFYAAATFYICPHVTTRLRLRYLLPVLF